MTSSEQEDYSLLSDRLALSAHEFSEGSQLSESNQSVPHASMGKKGRIIFVASGLFVLGVCTGAGLFGSHGTAPPASPEGMVKQAFLPPTIMVDVHGDVVHPGVYHLPAGARVADAVRMAGGFKHVSDAGLVNSAAVVDDGSEIEIRTSANISVGQIDNSLRVTGTPSGSNSPVHASIVVGNTSIDLNTATLESLETLPGVGAGRASAIIAYRRLHGPFLSISDLEQVHDIGKGIVGRIQPYLFISKGTVTNH